MSIETTAPRESSRLRTKSRYELIVALAVCLLGAVVLFLSAPHDGQFWWSDAPRHALNGVFVKDMLLAFPWRHPDIYAMQYYLQFPALTILFYPPLFYILLSPFYMIFGVSNSTALSVVLIHYVAFAFGLYILARRWLHPWLALAVGLLSMATPGIALWGRQVMLEIPMLAFVIWGLILFRRYVDSGRPNLLYWGSVILLCGVYTKLTALFVLPVVLLMVFAARGSAMLRDRHIWISTVLFLVGLIPIILLTLKFGHANIDSVAGIPDAVASRGSLSGWLWYGRQLPSQLGLPTLMATTASLLLLFYRRNPLNFDRIDLILSFGWFVTGYILLSIIDLKEARHSTLILPPLLVAAGLAIEGLTPERWSASLGFLLLAATCYCTWFVPVPYVTGYLEAAEWIANQAPENSVILFSGKRDGSFIFNLRSIEKRHDLYTVRADKLLLDVAIRREMGVKQKSVDEAEILTTLDQLGVRYVVAQSDFWIDLREMARLQAVLRSEHFREVARIPVISNLVIEDKELRIYQNLDPVNSNATTLKLDLPIIGRSVEGQVGGSH